MIPNSQRLLACCIIALAASCSLNGCAAFNALRPALSAAALTLLHELDVLLRSYEEGQTAQVRTLAVDVRASAAQADLYSNVHELLDLCEHQIPKKVLLPYRARLEAAARAAP